MVRGKDRNTGGSQQAIFFSFFNSFIWFDFQKRKKRIKTHTHTHTTVAYNTNTQKGGCERDARSHARNSLILKSE